MKKYLLLMFFFVPLYFIAQEKISGEIDLKELQISTAPSVILLGISPSELETPKSKKAIVFNIINSFKKNEGIPENYAFEVTPFWLLPFKNMTALKFAGIGKGDKQNIFSEVKKASLSLGFVRDLSLGADDEMKNPAFAFSARGTLIKIRTKKNKEDIIAQNKKVIKLLDKILEDVKNSEEYKKERTRILDSCMKNNIELDSCEKILENRLNAFIKKNKYITQSDGHYYRNLLEAPPLLSLDFAGGYSTFFSDNKFSNNHFGKLGFWITLNTGFDFTKKELPDVTKSLNFYGIVRYLEDGTNMDDYQMFVKSKSFDFGGKAEFVYNRFSVSCEYIYRVNDLEKTFRASGLLAYKVSDKIYINASFGKNYGDRDNLISFLGLNWGLDSEKKSVFVKK
ncbi:hypothetical protein [Chryseobacterium oryctis]|uniref:Uncharacterized protein n=1 Tax=Chryseobacterium oryctis TaxID=2952618 RepID=A0ABT3HQR2_9FLAO|nr:hypothetical protein [Chryseobacterium oryctis]MCW3162055.1 hypothetical protein [Chryseobacterium oryctis]